MNPILENERNQVADKIPDDRKDQFYAAVKAGRKLLYHPSTNKELQIIKNPKLVQEDPVGTISEGVSGLMKAMYLQSDGKMDAIIGIMVGLIMICEVLDYLEQGGKLQVTNELLAAIVLKFIEKIMQKLNITQEGLQMAIDKGRGEILESMNQQQPAAQPGLLNAGVSNG